MIHQFVYKVQLYPNKETRIIIDKTFGCCRLVWNHFVSNFNNYGSDSYIENLIYNKIRDMNDYEFMKEVSSQSVKSVQDRFREFQRQYFSKSRKKKIGRPKFKKKGREKESFTLAKEVFKVSYGKIKIPKCPYWIKFKGSYIDPDDELRNVTISKKNGKYYASILVLRDIELKSMTGNIVGIDMGFKDLLITSDGYKKKNLRLFRENQAKLKKLQRKLRKKKTGSNRWKKLQLKIAKLYEKIHNQLKDILHKESTRIVNLYDIICVESLNVSGMAKKFGKSVSETGISMFLGMIKYKSNWYGKSIIEIDKWFPSTQTCSCCGFRNEGNSKLTLKDRVWVCPRCNSEHDRDLNAAINIRNEGIRILSGS